jgi:ribosomal protein S18 acetylase RimI-like enzyme
MWCSSLATAPIAAPSASVSSRRDRVARTLRQSSLRGRPVPLPRLLSGRGASGAGPSGARGARTRGAPGTTAAFKPMERARGQDYAGAAACFVDAFFLRRDGGGDRITKGELSYLVGAQKKDLVKRYNQKSLGTMFVIKDEETNEVVGCVGAEVQRFVGATPARRSENDANGVVADRPVVANLAVASSARRKGLAKALMFAIEEEAKEWGFDETVLIVEANNKSATSLYKKLGYKAIGTEPDAPNLKVDENGKVVEAKVKAVTMRKSLKDGMAGTIENLDIAEVLAKVAGAGGIAYLANGIASGTIESPF